MGDKQRADEMEYISISEFARETGRSRTTVYKYLDSFLSNYVRDVQGRKVVSKAAIEAFKSIDAGKIVQEDCPCERPDSTDNGTESCSDGQDVGQINGQVEQVIEALKEQLRAKDQQIESLHDLLRESQAALSRQQQLTAIQEQRIVQLTAADPEEAEQQKKSFFRKILDVIRQQGGY